MISNFVLHVAEYV